MADCSQSGDSLHLPELRTVLLGRKRAGKSSSGNIILGGEEFPLRQAAQCVKREGGVAGRQVMVVQTPGWWRSLPVENSPELVKQEIVHSVSLCAPGPHALLLVVPLNAPFTEGDRRSTEQHMQLLSETVWHHTIVLFTHGGRLGDVSIERHIESEGKALRWLVERCGNRYHVFETESGGDGNRVPELLEKMEVLAAANGGRHYEIQEGRLERNDSWRKAKEDRAKRRQVKVEKQRQIHRSFVWDSLHFSELMIVLLGYQRAGKSSSGNTILGKDEFLLRPADQCEMRRGEVAGRRITLIQTPGWWINLPVVSTPEAVKQGIVSSVSLCPPGAHTLLLVVRLVVSLKDEETTAIEDHLQLLGENVWSHTIVLFTWGDHLGDTSIEQHIESEGKALQWLVEKCGNRYHVFNNKHRGDGGQVTELLAKIEELVAVNSGDVFYLEGVRPEKPAPPLDMDYPSSMCSSRPETYADSALGCEDYGEEDNVSDCISECDSLYGSMILRRSRNHSEFEDEDEGHPATSHFDLKGIAPSSEYDCSTAVQTPGDVFPVISPDISYRLWCPKAGGFQCSQTGLSFVMERKGVVHYSTAKHQARPLISIDCGQKSVRQLHVPRPTNRLTAEPHACDSKAAKPQSECAQGGSAEQELRSVQREFVKRISGPNLDSLLDGLQHKRIFNEGEVESVKHKPEKAERARELIKMVCCKGISSCIVMKDLLKEVDPNLYNTLGLV